MAPLSMTFSDLEGHYLFEIFLSRIPRKYSAICLHMNWKAHVACNLSYLFENEGLLKVTFSHVHCTCDNISETVPDRVVVTTDH